jgi:hypothetical protein
VLFCAGTLSLLVIMCGTGILALHTPNIAPAARVYPIVLIVLVIVCTMAVAAKEIVNRAATAPLNKDFAKILAAPARFRLRFMGFCGTWLLYPPVLSVAGFIVSTTAALSVSLWLLKVKRPVVGVVSAFAFSVTFAILFATALYIPTPSGPVDELLSQLLYAIQH